MMRKDAVYARMIHGGIGNQLFQYAAGRCLADQLGCELILDTCELSWPQNPTARNAKPVERQFSLDYFANARYLRDVDAPTSKHENYIKYKFEKLLYRSRTFRDAKPRTYNPDFFRQPRGTYLYGYWQSPQYFLPIDKQLRQDLTFTTPLNVPSEAMAYQITEAKSSVSLHVRRTDYLNEHGFATCQPSYYYSALQHIEDAVKAPLTCFIFSDDSEWVRANIKPKHETVIVDINDESAAYDDLLLQSLCDHNIIANSTFSWWAAWLNTNPHKIVVAPEEWFNTNTLSSRDIYPDDWIKVS